MSRVSLAIQRIFFFGGALVFLMTPAHFSLAEKVDGFMPQTQVVQHSIKERVMALRQQRFQQMPYLDKNFIRRTINPKKVQMQEAFENSGTKSLKRLINRSLEVNTSTKTARERISLSKRRMLVAVRSLFPEAQFEWEERKGRLSGRPFNNMNYRVNLRQPIFRGGALWNTLLQEKAGLEAASREYDVVLADLVNDVSIAFFEYNRALQVERDQIEAVSKMERFADISAEKFKEQIISEIEHLNVKSLYSQLQYDLETAHQEVEIAKLELQRFLDIDIDQNLAVKPLYYVDKLIEEMSSGEEEGASLDTSDKTAYSFEGAVEIPDLKRLVDLAYENRPELRVETARLDAARLEERIRWGGLLPQADLIFEFGRTAEAFDDVTTNPALREDYRLQLEFSWNVMGNTTDYTFEHDERAPSVSQFLGGVGSDFSRNNISVGVLDGLQALADVKEAEVEKLEQIEELEAVEREIILDVKQAYYDYQKAKIQVQSSVQRFDYRKRLRDLAEFRLGKNEIEISEYLQAENDVLIEKSALHEALADYYTAKAQLNHAIGITDHFEIEEEYGHKSA